MAFQTAKDSKYQHLVLSDETVIKELLTFRGSIDDTMLNGSHGVCATNTLKMNTDVISLFADLDELMKKCLNEEQLKLLEYIAKDYTNYNIGQLLGIPVKTVGRRFHTICLQIKQENDRQWRKVVYTKKLNLKTKRCSKCKERLPATDEFFSLNSSSKDLYHSQCKKCKK
ncbi:hypothetical protein [Lysinibacillus sphaericus]|uniref:Uncharacterized protein n=1 Tax=Lysinibacillus sphaericus OT4b.31 TaxID=1285586 RepID=R7ZFM9_LYSSH|nr:hypothetical protein [Lysinibacillus sphaericus]EON72846.1 hypothetical protein H131_09063 [Lysinibacillus sphaericus OT4b.31]